MNTVLKGKKIVISIIVTILLIDLVAIVFTATFYYSRGQIDKASYEFLTGVSRFIFECILLYSLYKGHKLAKWIIAILFLISGIWAAISLFAYFNIFIMLLGIAYTTIGITLLFSKSVKDFCVYQKGNNLTSDKNDETT